MWVYVCVCVCVCVLHMWLNLHISKKNIFLISIIVKSMTAYIQPWWGRNYPVISWLLAIWETSFKMQNHIATQTYAEVHAKLLIFYKIALLLRRMFFGRKTILPPVDFLQFRVPFKLCWYFINIKGWTLYKNSLK